MIELWQLFVQFVIVLAALLVQFTLKWSLLIAWLAWWLWGVNWKKAWLVLSGGAWVPVVLLMVIAALVWSQMAPSECPLFGVVTIPNFFWQLGAVGLIAGLTLCCGWLQSYFGWTPAEISLEPPAHEPAHAHGHGHH